MGYIELTHEERLAISALKRLAKRWPKSLWLYSASGLHVMLTGPNGQHMTGGGSSGGPAAIDPDYLVQTIDGIDTSGGDW